MLDRTMRGRRKNLQRIRQALHAEEFELYFQPKVSMRTGAVLGAEALIRWRHPELGLLMPDHFLPVMEGSLLIVELGEWVIASALAHLESWRYQGLDIPVSVNVDAMQLQGPKFAERLWEVLARHPHSAIQAGAGGLGEQRDSGHLPGLRGDPHLRKARRFIRSGRLRNRILIALAPEAIAGRRPQNR